MRKGTKNTSQIGIEIDAELAEEFKAFARDRGETLRAALEMSIRRHLKYPPPPPEVHPLPDSPAVQTAKKSKRST